MDFKTLLSHTGSVQVTLDSKVTLALPEVTLFIGPSFSCNIAKSGLTNIKGLAVDIPGPFKPGIHSALIQGNNLIVSAGPDMHKSIPLPAEIISVL